MKRVLAYGFFYLAVLHAAFAWCYTESDCIGCHDHKNLEKGYCINMKEFRSSIHGEMGCVDCHVDIKDGRHITGCPEKVNCLGCHDQENLHAPNGSVSCNACHKSHYIFRVDDPRSSVYWKNLKETCGRCHLEQSQDGNFLSMLSAFHIAAHPKQDSGKTFNRGMCVGCHQGEAAHGEDGPINDQVCYKCHVPLAKNNFLLGYVHSNSDQHVKSLTLFGNYVHWAAALALVIFSAKWFVGFLRKHRG